MNGAALRFLREHEPDILARAVETIREDLARLPDRPVAPKGPPPSCHKFLDTSYGEVEAIVDGAARISFVGAGFQSGILVGDRAYALAGNVNPNHPDAPMFHLTPLFSEDRTPVHQWKGMAPDLGSLGISAAADEELMEAFALRLEYDRQATAAANYDRAWGTMTASLRRLTARLDAIAPELSGLPTP